MKCLFCKEEMWDKIFLFDNTYQEVCANHEKDFVCYQIDYDTNNYTLFINFDYGFEYYIYVKNNLITQSEIFTYIDKYGVMKIDLNKEKTEKLVSDYKNLLHNIKKYINLI